ncbi:MAG: tetratricopeptide repeat protein [Bacteroidota bacterium]
MRYLTLIFLLLLTSQARSQNSQIDSLWSVLEKTADRYDRVDLLLEIGKIQTSSDILMSKETFEQVYTESLELNYTKGLVKAFNTLGSIYARSGNPDTALHLYNQSLALIGDNDQFVKDRLSIEYGIGTTIFRLGRYDSAIIQFEKLRSLAKQYQDRDGEAKALLLLGIIHNNEGRYYLSIDNELEALRISEETGDIGMQSMLLNNIATVYYDLGENENCLIYLKKSLEIADASDLRHQANVLSNISGIESDLGNYDDALIGYKKAISLRYQYGDSCSVGPDLNSVASVYLRKNQSDTAIVILNKAAKLNNNCNDYEAYVSSLNWLGSTAFDENRISDAEKYYLQVYTLATRHGFNGRISQAAEKLYRINKEFRGNTEKALEYLETYNELSDSLESYADQRKISQLEAKYTFDKEKALILAANEKEDLIQRQRLQNQKYWTYSFVVGLILVIIIAIVFYRNYQERSRANRSLALQNEEISRQKEELNQSNEKLKELSSFKESMTSMIAHDLKNPLGVILGTDAERPATRLMARQMLNLVNNMLDVHKFENTEVKLQTGAHLLSDIVYESIEQVRPLSAEKNVIVHVDLQESFMVMVDREYIIRVFVNFLTNAIKYSPNNRSIEIAASELIPGKGEIRITDHGKGIAKGDQNKIFDSFEQLDPTKSGNVGSTGLGLTFCKLALRAHGSEIKVESKTGEGSTFIFDLPLSDLAGSTFIRHDEKEPPILVLTADERAYINGKLPELRNMKMHQVLELEALLDDIDQNTQVVLMNWVQEVVNAAYSDNQSRYDELIGQV